MKIHPRPIVVIGMQRSGTSALSGALHGLGLFFGKEEMLYQGDANNPQGYFEHRKATILNLRGLHEFQMHPTSFGRLPSNWQEHPLAPSLIGELKAFLETDFSGQGRWGIKQPVTSLVMPLYNEVFRLMGIRPHYVLCVRSPLETMRSEAKLDFGEAYRVMPSLGEAAIGSWLRYTLGSFADAEDSDLTVIGYEELLTSPTEALRRVLEVHPDWAPSEAEWEEAAGSIRGDLRHNRVDLAELDRYPTIVRKTYTSILEFRGGDRGGLLGLYDEYLGWVEMFSEPKVERGLFSLSWIADRARQFAQVPYSIDGEWVTVRLEVKAPPRTRLFGTLLDSPARIWIRGCVWKVGDREMNAPLSPGLASSLSVENGIYKLDATFEPNQFSLETPANSGNLMLELSVLVETGEMVAAEVASGVAKKLDRLVDVVDAAVVKVRGV